MANPNPTRSPATQFKPGVSGNPNGRPKALLPRVDLTLVKNGKDPVTELLALIPKLRPEMQAKVWLDLLAYCHAKASPESTAGDAPAGTLKPEELTVLRKLVTDGFAASA